MKKILIIGASKGIGKACTQYFTELGHDVITVARTNAHIIGDITDNEFRTRLVKDFKSDVVINCAGQNGAPVNTSLLVNYAAITDLMFKFYESLDPGSSIINISSMASHFSKGWHGIPLERISYMTSKNAITDVCLSLSKRRTRDIKVTTIEPELVMPTSINEFHQTKVHDSVYSNYQFNQFAPITPRYIAEVINWIIDQPPWITIAMMTISNNFDHHRKNNN